MKTVTFEHGEAALTTEYYSDGSAEITLRADEELIDADGWRLLSRFKLDKQEVENLVVFLKEGNHE